MQKYDKLGWIGDKKLHKTAVGVKDQSVTGRGWL